MYATIVEILQPIVLLLLLIAGAIAGLWRNPSRVRRWRAVLTVAFTGLWVLSTPAVAFLALGSLEWHFSPLRSRPSDAEAIVVLGGYIVRPNAEFPRGVLGWDSYLRCLRAFDLYRDGRPCPIIVSGGKVSKDQPGPTIAESMSAFLISQGIPAQDVMLEPKSSNTFENARETCKLLRAKNIRRVVVVTHAAHLLRAQKCFRKQGYEITPAGCNFATLDSEWSPLSFLPNLGAAGDVCGAFHEWLGIVYYRLLGRIG